MVRLSALAQKLHAYRGKLVLMFACILALALGAREGLGCCTFSGAAGTMGDCTYVAKCPLSVGCLNLRCTLFCPPKFQYVEVICSGIGCMFEYCCCSCG